MTRKLEDNIRELQEEIKNENESCEQKFRLKEPAVAQASCETVEACPAHSLKVKPLALKNIGIAIKGLPQVHP